MTSDDFEKEFKRLEAAFGMFPDPDRRAMWFREVGECKFYDYRQAIGKLTRHKDRNGQPAWPTFSDFWDVYRTVAGPGASKKIGCANCRHGYIHHVVRNNRMQRDDEVVSFCGDCHPGHPFAINPRQAFRYVPGTEPFKRKDDKQIPRDEAHELVQEFLESYANVHGMEAK